MFFSILKKSLITACYAFSALVVLYALLMLCLYDSSSGVYMSAKTVFFFFPLSYFVSVANFVVKDTKLRGGLKLFVHFVTVTLSLVLFIYLPHGGGVSPVNAMIVFAAYTVVYALGAAVLYFVKAKNKSSKEKTSEYKNVY